MEIKCQEGHPSVQALVNVAYSLCHMHCDYALNFGERFMCFPLRRDDCDVATRLHGFWFYFCFKLI